MTSLSLYAEVSGPAPGPGVDTFLLIHGYGACTFTWRHWAPRLAERGHVVAVDLKGCGRSPKPDDGAYAPADHAQLVHRLVEQRDLRRLTLVGHSLGGAISLLTALRLLDAGDGRLDRLVIVAGAAYDQRLPPFVRLADYPTMSAAAFRVVGAPRVVRAVLEQVVYDPAGVDDAQVRGYAEPLASEESVRALLETARLIRPPDLHQVTARYRELNVPALLIWGRTDRVVPLEVGERLTRELPNARLHVLDRCGHIPAEERPDESFELVRRFLDESGQRTST